jgi:hypothetical protein
MPLYTANLGHLDLLFCAEGDVCLVDVWFLGVDSIDQSEDMFYYVFSRPRLA